MNKKPKMFGGKFNPEEVEAIERTLDALNINSNQMVREAVSFWMMIRPAATLLESNGLGS